MILFPAIDILDGACVRLLHGDYSQVTLYGDPVAMAKKWAEAGARYLHVVDLNAAKSGQAENLPVIKEIAKTVSIPVQTGGGVRTLHEIERRLQAGAARVILGTVCCKDPEIVSAAVKEFGAERIVCGIDAKDGTVATDGWLHASQTEPADLGKAMAKRGVRYVVYTDISKDGTLTGVNADACRDMAAQTGLHVIASGGIGSLEDIRSLQKYDMYGAILGKALYADRFTLQSALQLTKE